MLKIIRMKETIAKLKTIISLIEKGEIKGENLNEINRFFDSIMTVIEPEKSLSYREELENMDRSSVLKCLDVNNSLLNQKKEEILNQFEQDKYDTEKCIQILSINECVLENLKDLKSDAIEEKLLFSHWKVSPENFLIDFKTNNGIWDYATTHNYHNINDIISLGLDVPDDFDGRLWSLKEPQRSTVEILYRQPFNKPIFVFFVNRNNIYYLENIQVVYPKCNETKNFKVIKSMIPKLRISQKILELTPEKLDNQLLHVSKMFDKSLNLIPNIY